MKDEFLQSPWKAFSFNSAAAELTIAHGPSKQLQHTMENSTDSMSDKDYKSLVNQCLEMCSGCKFSLSLRLGSSFNFSLSSEGCSPETAKRPRRAPSYLRRQNRRRAAFLERKKKLPLADEVAGRSGFSGQEDCLFRADVCNEGRDSCGQRLLSKPESESNLPKGVRRVNGIR